MSTSNRQSVVRTELLSQLFSASNASLASSIVLSAILAYAQMAVVESVRIVAWFVAIVIVSIGRMYFVHRYQGRITSSPVMVARGLLGYRLFISLSAIVWGSSGFLLFPEGNQVHQMALVIILIGLASGAVVSLSADIFCAMIFPIAVMSPLMARMFVTGDSFAVGIGLAMALYIGFMTINSRRIHRVLTDNTLLRIEALERERDIRNSEQRYRLLLEHAPVGIFHYDTNLVITYSNNHFVRMLNSTLDRVMGINMNQIHDQDALPVLKGALSGKLGYFKGHYRATFSNAEGWISMVCAPFENEAGHIDGGVAIVEEVTEQKKAELALQASEANYRELVDNVNAIILRMALDGTVTYFNAYAENFFGYKAADILGRHVVGTIVPETESNSGRDLSQMIADILANPERFADNQNENMTSNGRRVIVRWANQVILDDNHKPSGVLSIGTDITAQKQAEQTLVFAKKAAEAANVAKSEFLATMSHEIRTPMNGILGMAQLLMDDRMEDEQRKDYARTILNSGQTLLTLLNDILDLSKVEAGKMELSNSIFDPRKLIQESANLFTQSAQEKGLKLEVEWKGTPDTCYKADATRLRQMLSNLIGNAIKFTHQGFVRIEASLMKESERRAMLEFSVTDSGIGLTSEQQSRLFQPFTQADSSTTREYGGSGLGLSIIRSLSKLMNGTVGIESMTGQGSRFWFQVWVDIPEKEEERRHVSRTAELVEQEHPVALIGKILLVEDNAINRKVAEAALKRLGLEFQSVENGQEAVDLVRNGERPSLILMDMQMPVMDGVTATRHIRAWEKETHQMPLPIIALTANAFEEDRQRCREAGMDDFLSKPFSLEILSGVISKWGTASFNVQS